MAGLRIGFMGTPDFALEALKALDDANKDIVAIYSQPPRPKGRGHKVQPSPVHQFGLDHDIPVYHPKSLKGEEAQKEFAALNLDVAIVAAYGLLLPKAVLEAPKYGCINIHASLLPRWRGASPIQRAIWAGDSETGISLMQMDEGLDTGPVLMEGALPITGQTTCAALHDDLCALSRSMVVELIERMEKGDIPEPTAQNDAQSTYAPLLTKDDGRVDWSQNAAQIDRQIRALNPWPGVWTTMNGARLKILSAALESLDQPGESGQIINKKGLVSCGEGTSLRLIQVQPEGKKAMDFASALNGGYVQIGERFA